LRKVTVIGGGPAGASAAITAMDLGAEVTLYERSRFPRHKVCGEYLSPEILPLLDQLGVRVEGTRLARLLLHFPRSSKQCRLPESACGFSRHALDALLLGRANRVVRERRDTAAPGDVVAHGRQASATGIRQFGFKAHFSGPQTDSIELFFFNGCYVGVNSVDGGMTNVCGLGPEDVLRRCHFLPDALLESFPPLRDRTRPLAREMDWLTTGPLAYRQRRSAEHYLAGDALSFVDPFTGSGLLSAVVSGISAGTSAARGESVEEHQRRCAVALRRPFLVSSLIRASIRQGWADLVLPAIPGSWLVHATRPRV
jgi:flavin-dependent dehydrogenase